MAPHTRRTARHRLAARVCPLTVALLGLGCGDDGAVPAAAPDLEATFRAPSSEFRPWTRWWWPGGAVEDDVVAAELGRLAALGFGGVEVQPFRWGLTDEEVAADPRILTVGTAEQRARVNAAANAAAAQGIAFSLTLGSGWPSGGGVPLEARPEELLLARVDVVGPTNFTGPLPPAVEPAWVAANNTILEGRLSPFERPVDVVAVLGATLDAAVTPPVLGEPVDLTSAVQDGALTWAVPPGPHTVIVVYRHPLNHPVLGGAYVGGLAGSRVVNHLDGDAVDAWLRDGVGAALDALDGPPAEVFVDSPELLGELPWSPALTARFVAEKGYDPTPLWPWCFLAEGEAKYSDLLRGRESPPAFASPDPDDAARVREDYEDVRSAVFATEYVDRLMAFAEARGTRLRFQAHGGWGVHLDDYARAHVPETEQLYAGGSADFLSLASSAAHVAGRPVVSAEAFVSLSPAGPLALDELWRLAGRAFGAGIQRLVHHGSAYPYVLPGGRRWYPFQGMFTQDFAAEDVAALLPAFNLALTRLSWALTQGEDRAEVAWLLPERQLPDRVAVGTDAERYESPTSLALRGAGLVYDRISPAMLRGATAADGVLTVGAARYRGLLLADWAAADPEALEAAAEAARTGLPVVILGDLPGRARGRVDRAARDARVAVAATTLSGLGRRVDEPTAVPEALMAAGVTPPLTPLAGDCERVALRHRDLDGRRLSFVFNEGDVACTARLRPASATEAFVVLDPESGASSPGEAAGGVLAIPLPAARGRVLLTAASP